MLADGSRRVVTIAKVTSYAINVPIGRRRRAFQYARDHITCRGIYDRTVSQPGDERRALGLSERH